MATNKPRRVRLKKPVSSPMWDEDLVDVDKAAQVLEVSRAEFIRLATNEKASQVLKRKVGRDIRRRVAGGAS